MTDHGDEQPLVTFTTKELLARIEAKIDALHIALRGKASQESVDHLERRITRIEGDVFALKAKWAQIMAIVAVATLAIPLIVAVLLHVT